MVVSCCDSRIHATEIFGVEQGEFFMHRNIANLVPPYQNDGGPHGTAAALEYGVTALKVPHLIVLGHSQCGGVQGCADMCAGRAPQLEEAGSFVGRWIDALRPAYEKVAHLEGREQSLALEHQGVVTSLENLMTYPFIKERVEAGQLELHGLWTDIASGDLMVYAPAKDAFEAV